MAIQKQTVLHACKSLFEEMTTEQKEQFIIEVKTVYDEDIKADYSFSDVVNEFMNNTNLENYQYDILYCITQTIL